MWLKSLFTVTCALTMTACAHSPAPSPERTELQESLRVPCPALPEPTSGTAKDMLRWGVQVVELYAECKSRHQRTVEAFP